MQKTHIQLCIQISLPSNNVYKFLHSFLRSFHSKYTQYNGIYIARANLNLSKLPPPLASAEISEPQPLTRNMTSRLEDDWKEFVSGQRDYWRQVAQSDGFDIDDVSVPRGTTGLWSVDCQHRRYRQMCCLPKLYAMVGLHRYNMLKGTNLQLSALLKYNKSMNCVHSFFLTSVAVDHSSQLQKTFQVRADEKSFGKLDLTVSIARPKDEEEVTSQKRFMPHFHGEAAADDFYKGRLPDWPSVDDLNNQKRFYLVNESELQANDWIHQYLELAVCARHHQKTREWDLSKLKILKVAIETKEEDVQPPNGRLKAKSAYVYITFKGLAKAPIGDEFGEHVERKAIVRRVIDEHTGYLTLLGGFSIGVKTLNTEQPVSREEALDNEQPVSREEALDNGQSSGKRRRLD